jgi:hypothetical protein
MDNPKFVLAKLLSAQFPSLGLLVFSNAEQFALPAPSTAPTQTVLNLEVPQAD